MGDDRPAAVRIPEGKALGVTVALPEIRRRALATGLLKPPFGFSINDDHRHPQKTAIGMGVGTDGGPGHHA